jgi:DNA-binding NarL/FixJ family response regulator
MKNKLEKLSVIEEAILRMMVGEMTDNEIAFALDITENTVEKHFKNIFGKLKAGDKNAAKAIAIKSGFVRIDI